MFLDEAWFWRGFQSAIFYYLSCAPCSKHSYRRNQRKKYKRAKAETALTQTEEGLYQHPSPFSTNRYWREEMDVGPGPPARKGVRDGRGKPMTGKQKKDRQLRTGGVGSSTDTGDSSADTIVDEAGSEQVRDSTEGWNKKRYQREDEILWGGVEMQESTSLGLQESSSSASRPSYQYYARNPAINDLHPPVVSTQPRNKTETLWMLQPPPKAKVMAGKERASIANTPNRSRSTSGGSYGGKGTMMIKDPDMSLGRQVGERLMESKLKQGKLPESSVEISRVSSIRSNTSALSNVSPGQPHDRDTVTLSRTRSISSRRTKPPPPPPISISKEPDLPSPPPERPPLSTIPSETLPQRQKGKTSYLRPHLITAKSTSSLQVLQELDTSSPQLNLMKVASDPLPHDGLNVELPPVSQQEDEALQLAELESYFPGADWNFLTGHKDGDSRHSRHRWTMSI